MRYVSTTRLVVELVRGTWCCKTNTDWRLCTDDFVSWTIYIDKAGSVSRRLSKWTVYTYSDVSTCTWICVLFNKWGRGDARTQGLFIGEETPNGELLNSVMVSTFMEKRWVLAERRFRFHSWSMFVQLLRLHKFFSWSVSKGNRETISINK